jgi:hypothetical protein
MTGIEGFRNSKNPSKIGPKKWLELKVLKNSKNWFKIGPKTGSEVQLYLFSAARSCKWMNAMHVTRFKLNFILF